MANVKKKKLYLAIGLNILLPGLGYMYMGKVLVGIAALFLIIMFHIMFLSFYLAFFRIPPNFSHFLLIWFIMNICMASDMLKLGGVATIIQFRRKW